MSYDPGEGTSDGHVKRNTVFGSENEVKEEHDIKLEPADGMEFDSIQNQSRSDEQNEENVGMKSESETDSEFDLELSDMKQEIKCEKKDKKNSATAQSSFGSAEGGDVGENINPGTASNPRKSKSMGRKQRKRINPGNQVVKKQKQHRCHLCPYKSSYGTNLVGHIQVHGEKPFHCDVCSKTFSYNSNLKRHMKVHGPKYQFQCSKCRQGFSVENEKIYHEQMCKHRLYECHLCKYCTTSKSMLQRHMKTHSGDKPFQCSTCFKSFARKENRNEHSRTHISELRFGCSKCGQRFEDDQCKESHEKHCQRRRFECHLCRYNSFTKNIMGIHMKFKHTGGKPFECEVCGKKFVHKSDLNKHMITHCNSPYQCSKCRRGFTAEAGMIFHENLCRRRQYQCWLCKAFQLSITNLRRHVCVSHRRKTIPV